jgi:hypothetical protein
MRKQNIGKWLLATLGILVLCLLIWNTVALNQIQQEQERLWVELYGIQPRLPSLHGTQGDLDDMKSDLSDMQKQLDGTNNLIQLLINALEGRVSY